jgi:protease-4
VNQNNGQRILAWAILLICLAAVPVGLWSKQQTTSSDDKSDKEEKRLSFLGKKDRIQIIRLAGTIINDEDSSSSILPDTNSPTYVRKQLRKAAENDHIKAVLLRINSPGGTVAMSQELCDAVKAIRTAGKPVVVSMGDVTASGGYYIASAADKIYACPGTLTGSIGVIMHLMNLSEIEKKIGVAPVTIKSGQFKDIGTMDRAPTKEEQELLSNIIMDSYDQFVTAVSEGRKIDKEQVKKLADGRIYSGRQALKVKLVDALGGYEEALADIKKTCKDKYHKDLYVDEGRSSMGLLASLLESKLSTPKIEVFKGVLPESMNPRFANQPLWLME